MTFVTPLLYMLVSTNVNEKGLLVAFLSMSYLNDPGIARSMNHLLDTSVFDL